MYKVVTFNPPEEFFCVDWKSKMATTTEQILHWTLCKNILESFLSEIKKLFWQQTWLDCSVNSSFQNIWFCVNRKSKMAAIEGHSFNRGTYMKMKNIFFSDTRNRLHRKGTLNCHFYFLWIWNPSWLVSQVIVLTMGKWVTSLFSKTLKLHENKQADDTCSDEPLFLRNTILTAWIVIEQFLTNFSLCVDPKKKMAATAGNI
jgi:hypothetical protein